MLLKLASFSFAGIRMNNIYIYIYIYVCVCVCVRCRYRRHGRGRVPSDRHVSWRHCDNGWFHHRMPVYVTAPPWSTRTPVIPFNPLRVCVRLLLLLLLFAWRCGAVSNARQSPHRARCPADVRCNRWFVDGMGRHAEGGSIDIPSQSRALFLFPCFFCISPSTPFSGPPIVFSKFLDRLVFCMCFSLVRHRSRRRGSAFPPATLRPSPQPALGLLYFLRCLFHLSAAGAPFALYTVSLPGPTRRSYRVRREAHPTGRSKSNLNVAGYEQTPTRNEERVLNWHWVKSVPQGEVSRTRQPSTRVTVSGAAVGRTAPARKACIASTATSTSAGGTRRQWRLGELLYAVDKQSSSPIGDRLAYWRRTLATGQFGIYGDRPGMARSLYAGGLAARGWRAAPTSSMHAVQSVITLQRDENVRTRAVMWLMCRGRENVDKLHRRLWWSFSWLVGWLVCRQRSSHRCRSATGNSLNG